MKTTKRTLVAGPAIVFSMALGVLGAPQATAGQVGYWHEFNRPAQISVDVPRNWVVSDELTLWEQGFVVAPMPLYALVASPSTTPSHAALNPSSVPWLFVTVETDENTLPSGQLYQLVPNYLESLLTQSGSSVTGVKTIMPHHPLHLGGLNGSGAALTVVSPAGSTSVDEAAYASGGKLWMVIAGCSEACYESNVSQITHIVNSLSVGKAARP